MATDAEYKKLEEALEGVRNLLALVRADARILRAEYDALELRLANARRDAYEECAKICAGVAESIDPQNDFDAGVRSGYEGAAQLIENAAEKL